jgi:hypothetical protein
LILEWTRSRKNKNACDFFDFTQRVRCVAISPPFQFAKGPARERTDSQEEGGNSGDKKDQDNEERLMGCAPYLQIFKAGQLVFTTAATLHFHQSEEELPFVQGVDGPVPFNVEQIIQGDILIRCRHLTFGKQRVSMFRSAFHTGYVPPNVMRLTKSQLDGACGDKRFPDDLFLDLIFEKVDAETATRHLETEAEAAHNANQTEDETLDKGKKGPVVKASSYDTMLQGGSRFWDVINARRQEHVSQQNDDPNWGPTVGRRRGDDNSIKKKKTEGGEETKSSPPKERTQLETFSIGNEFDFLPQEPKPATTPPVAAANKQSPQRDSLMDALNALDEDEGPVSTTEADLDTEEIVFDDGHGDATKVADVPPLGEAGTVQDTKDKTEPSEQSTVVAMKESSKASNSESSGGVDTASSNIDSLADDMDELLALSTGDEDFGDMDLADFDDDDDMDDLEAMLKT